MTNARRRRQTRTRLTTGFPPELHNAIEAERRAARQLRRAMNHAQRTLQRIRITQREAAQLDAALAAADEADRHYEERAAARARTLNGPAKCLLCITADSDTTPHDPSPRCTASSEPHCNCTTCL